MCRAREGERSCEAAGSACSQVKREGASRASMSNSWPMGRMPRKHAFDTLALEGRGGSGLSGRVSVLLGSMYTA